MTMIASSLLRQITRSEGCHDPAEILKRLNFAVKTSLHQDTRHGLSDDGMDAAICFVSEAGPDQKILKFAGAKLPLICVCDGEVTVLKGDRQDIGYRKSDTSFNFTEHTIPIERNMSFYLASDGFADQLGGKTNRRLGSKRYHALLQNTAKGPSGNSWKD